MKHKFSRRIFGIALLFVNLSLIGIMLAFLTSMAEAVDMPEDLPQLEEPSTASLSEDQSPYEAPSVLLMQEELPHYEAPSAAAEKLAWPIIENAGQFDPQARFMMRLDGRFLWLADDGLWITAFDGQALAQAEETWRTQGDIDSPIPAVNVKLSFIGADSPVIEPFNRQDTDVSYFLGNDANKWRSKVPVWGGVRYRDLYPGVDLVLGQDSLEAGRPALPWHLETSPDADLGHIQLLVEGADLVSVSGDELLLSTQEGDLAVPMFVTDYQIAPDTSVQQSGDQRFMVTAPLTAGGELEFVESAISDNPADLVYSTYLGGSEWDSGSGIAVDDAGMVYAAGSTPSADFPSTPGAFKTTLSLLDAYVIKLDPAGNGSNDLIYATFLGGDDQTFDFAGDLTVVNGEAYVGGNTASSSFPTTPGAFDRSCGNDGDCDTWDDAFFAQLSSDGSSLLYGTYLGGKDQESATSIDVSGGEIYLAGYTKSEDFPTTFNAFDRECGSDGVCNKAGNIPLADAFFVKLATASNGSNDQLYGTFLGGFNRDQANGIDASAGDAFITGWSSSFDFPASGFAGGNDAFVVRIDPVGGGSSDQIYGTFLGGSNDDTGNGIAVVGSHAFVTGETRSPNFPVTSGAFNGGSSDAYLSKLDDAGTILYSAFLGGSGDDVGYDIALDEPGAAVLTGLTASSDFPVTETAFDLTLNGNTDLFVARIYLNSAKPQHITYASYLGGNGDFDSDIGNAVAVDAFGHAYLTGSTESVDFPTTTGAFDTTLAGSKDSFVAKMKISLPPAIDIQKSTNNVDADEPPGLYLPIGTPITWSYVLTNTGGFAISDVTVSDDQLGAICNFSTMNPEESQICTASSTATAGQYANLGTASGQPPDGLDPVSDNDPSHYFGSIPNIVIEKQTNGEDADTSPGPLIRVGDVVSWTFGITNSGNVPLSSIIVTDNPQGAADCPYDSLAANQSMSCTITSTAVTGPYSNDGQVTAVPPGSLQMISDNDPSHYFGADPSLAIQKFTLDLDVDEMPGPLIPEGDPVSWTYAVTNTGNVPLTAVSVTDDQGVAVSCPLTELAIDESMICSANDLALSGQYTNTGIITGTPPVGLPVSASDLSHYFGTSPALSIEKRTNDLDADLPPGPFILAGDPVTWTYIITNTGNITLSAITVVDDPPVTISCPKSELAVDESMTCSANGLAISGQYANLGTVTGTPPVGLDVSNSDTSHYFGATPDVVIEKRTADRDADLPPGPYLAVGDTVTWTYTITNSGNVSLSSISVVDDHAVTVSCPEPTLSVGASMICTATDLVISGQYSNLGTVSALPPVGPAVSDEDVSHYFGSSAGVSIEKSTNGDDADTSPGPLVLADSTVTWTYLISNTGDVGLSNITVTDSDPLVVITCPETSLAVGEFFECEAAGAAEPGQYSNLGTVVAKPPDDLPAVTAEDPSHYFGAVTQIGIEKSTNGQDADAAPGPIIIVGDDINWTYDVTNEGNVALSGIVVTDDRGVAVTCPDDVLDPGIFMTCTAGGTAVTGQYSNLGTAGASPPGGLPDVSDSDPSHYLGVNPAIALKKLTNGQEYESAPGAYIVTGDPVSWTYVISNTGDITLTNVTVIDDQGVTVTCPVDTVPVGESISCTADGTAAAGQYSNLGTASAQPINNITVISATDTSYYFGADLNLVLEKSTNGVDADEAPGPYIPVDEPVNWSFHVINSSNVTLTQVLVVDDQQGAISCPIDILIPSEEMTCSLSGTAVFGQYSNTAQVTGTPPGGLSPLQAGDSSHYFGTGPAIDIEKRTNGESAGSAPGPYIPIGQPVAWTYQITNIGNITLTNVTVVDDQSVVVSCPENSLDPGEVMQCTGNGTAQAGQYANIGTVTGTPPVGPIVSAEDTSHYFGSDPGIVIEKSTNGQDADVAPGPTTVETLPVNWTYNITNTGNVTLSPVTVTDDDPGVTLDCPLDTLAVGQSMSCTAAGVAVAGQYSNLGTAVGTPPVGADVNDNDPSHYFGLVADPAVAIEKKTNGEKADSPPGPFIPAGDPIAWTYLVSNTGNLPLTAVSVADSDPGVTVLCPQDTLYPDESITCTAVGVAQAGQYSNIGTAAATPPNEVEVSDSSSSYYFGSDPAVALEKSTNGFDADARPGPFILIGDSVSWSYHISNTGNVTLTEIIVSDDQGVDVTCPADVLAPGDFMTCSGEGISMLGQYSNTGIVTGTPPVGTAVNASDPSHYFGSDPHIQLEKRTEGEDADDAPGPYILVGEIVNWTYEVSNAGNVTLTNVIVDDDQGVVVTCPKNILNPGEGMTCTGSEVATKGAYSNVGLAKTLEKVSDDDPSHYFGSLSELTIQKRTNGQDADDAPGPQLIVGDPVTWTYKIRNTGSIRLEKITVTDSQGVNVSCPKSVLAAGTSMICSANGIAVEGQYSNTGLVEGQNAKGAVVTADDPSHYFGSPYRFSIYLPGIFTSKPSSALGVSGH